MVGAALLEACPAPGHVWIGRAAAVSLGPSLRLAPHSTSVACLVLGIDAPVSVSAAQESVIARSVLVPPRTTRHVEASPDQRLAFAYLDVTCARFRDVAARMTRRDGTFLSGHQDEERLFQICTSRDPQRGDLESLIVAPRAEAIDPRMTQVLTRMRQDPATGASALASEVGLSTFYLLRRFGDQTGTTLRRHRLWTRMLAATRLVAGGSDLTRAAVDAGFASPSHLSDTFSAMFGLSATALLGTGVRLHVADEEVA